MADYYTTNTAAVAGVAKLFREKDKISAFDPENDNCMSIELSTPAQYRPHIKCEENYQAPKCEHVGEYYIFTFGKEFKCDDFREFIDREGVVVFQNEESVEIVTKQKETARKIKDFVQRGKSFHISYGGRFITVSLL